MNSEGFTEALAGCKSLFCAAGNQLLGEAVYYGKKIFAIPEPNQPEQTINAFYLEKMGHGMTCRLHQLDNRRVRKFLESFNPTDLPHPTNGVYDTIEVIKRYAKK